MRKGLETMSEGLRTKGYKREVTPIERLFTRSPYAIVTMVARIRGSVTESRLRNALNKVRQRHPNLRVRIAEGDEGTPWFTSEAAGELQVEIVPRESDNQWIKVVQESSQIPFAFHARPPIRFILIRSPTQSELIILCHHIICDGLSLAYLARDLMVHLGDPTRDVQGLPDPVPILRDGIPEDVSLNRVARFLINRINRKWHEEKVVFDQEDYESLTKAYWTHYQHQVLTAELPRSETSALVDRCRNNGVTVNSALCAAIIGAQRLVLGAKPSNASSAVAGNLRERLQPPVGEVMGFYAGSVTPTFKYQGSRGFWDNARAFHRRIRPLFTNKNFFENFVTWCYLDPSIMEAIPFKALGVLVSEESPRHQKLSAFAARDDTIRSVLRREKMDSLDRITVGTAVTNLTRLGFPHKYGALELERLIMKAGGAFPLANFNLLLGAVTCAGKLSLLIEFVEQNVDVATMEEVKERALALLLSE
jgi:hypothetical protein